MASMPSAEIDHELLLEVFVLQDDPTAAALPRHRHSLTRRSVQTRQRARIILATAEAVNELTLAKTTARIIVERAGVSTKTFYAHFANKEEAFLAMFTLLDGIVAQTIERAVQRISNPRAELRAAVHGLLVQLAAWPSITEARLIAGRAGGRLADQSRHAMLDTLISSITAALERATTVDPQITVPAETTLLILAGGVYEYVTRHVFEHGTASLPDLTPGIATSIETLIYRDPAAAQTTRP